MEQGHPSEFERAALSRWSAEQAQQWYAAQPRLLGSNYVPADAINQIEMWENFNRDRIGLELDWARDLGMNTKRVFLHDLLWFQDAPGFKSKIDEFLDICAERKIRPMLVLFDSCWDPCPALGQKRAPLPGVHNSGWVQGPGAAVLRDPTQHARLKDYVQDVVSEFGHDERVLAWDMWNEPDNAGMGNYAAHELTFDEKSGCIARILPQVFAWGREVNPSQPMTSGIWKGDWSNLGTMDEVSRIQVSLSDIVSFHNYNDANHFRMLINQLSQHGRPMVCTEFMARPQGSTLQNILPVARENNVGMYCWGFVSGRSQTNMPWDSWERPYVETPPEVWFHDLLLEDGSPYLAPEIEYLKAQARGIAQVFEPAKAELNL
jgi:hypothetical protein